MARNQHRDPRQQNRKERKARIDRLKNMIQMQYRQQKDDGPERIRVVECPRCEYVMYVLPSGYHHGKHVIYVCPTCRARHYHNDHGTLVQMENKDHAIFESLKDHMSTEEIESFIDRFWSEMSDKRLLSKTLDGKTLDHVMRHIVPSLKKDKRDVDDAK